MNEPRHDFLADAGFARDEDLGVAARRGLDIGPQLSYGDALTEKERRRFRGVAPVHYPEFRTFGDGFLHSQYQSPVSERPSRKPTEGGPSLYRTQQAIQ